MTTTIIPDALLVRSYIEGNENALAQLVDRHQTKIYSFIYSKVQDTEIANDIFQDVFIKVIKTLKGGGKHYNEEGKFLPWVMRIAHNLIIDTFRKEKKMPKYRDTEEFSVFSLITDGSPNIEMKMITEQVENDLIRLIEELPDDQRQVLEMRIYDDLSFKEIAEITGVSINTALGRMRYALLNMRRSIEKNNITLAS
ncbi:RNA polymerase subunit sigma-24 [Flavobacterium covae]|uniref:Sigma-70 family RNA polymerase sigma factor n=2 Tax=Flavobacterium TaxID=237 RepID=A0AA94F1C2_9FLAO|nr:MULTISPECIES: sigma-70 family RNA polymerase sigma factor [Flavobacterium]OXA74546.1 RNA polymerase subunit sigma-24 [Flavobacterium columnare NBRC 100251 = ATCC 23463]AND62965.1 RNA polymerase subunit sigma-24 [Flavobacterium covae]MCH4828513.1 sigma-70 family RNA polymerase sigma factor [Flavobacterium columnare]MCH4831767.1 sigma-70 family RNA polymerase sigma factor [Flavobacterium columnare]MCJ1805335.1 sigma-70 family RNA polymerase sigma factor [Flavobacterium covae]